MKSWLAKAKSIHDIRPAAYVCKPGHPEWDDKRDSRLDEKWRALMRRLIPVEAQYLKYFGSCIHDSWIVGIDRTPQVLRVKLDSLDGIIFSRTFS